MSADADVDGNHIKGLLVNIFEFLWPELVKRDDFHIMDFQTSVISVDHGKKRYTFKTMTEYHQWCEENPKLAKLTPEYKKGLASFDKDEITKDKENDVNKEVPLRVDKKAGKALDLAFKDGKKNGKSYVVARREWILDHDYSEVMKMGKEIKVSDFINYLVVYHAKDSLERTMVSFDGFKQSSRKIATTVLFMYLAGGFRTKTKTVALGGEVIKTMEYFHGEQSLYKTIERLTQGANYPGTSNLPFLKAGGLFSDRTGLKGGQARYTSSLCQDWWPAFFKKVDLDITPRMEGEAKETEFKYIPQVIPYILCNFTTSIGTGWACFIPGCRPLALLKYIRAKLNGEETTPLRPWARGFKGSMRMIETSKLRKSDKEEEEDNATEVNDDTNNEDEADESSGEEKVEEDTIPAGNNSALYSLLITGKWHVDEKGVVVVTEIPIGKTFTGYKDFLHRLKENGDIKDYDDLCDDKTPLFHIYGMKEPSDEKLKLRTVKKLSNMYILGDDGKPIRFDTLTEIADAWFEWNKPHYVHRRKMLLMSLKHEIEVAANRADFIKLVNDGVIKLERRPKANIIADAESNGIKTEHIKSGLDIWSLTKEKEKKLRSILEKKKDEYQVLKEKTPDALWLEDLDEVEADLY